jgi:hypothetical protein
MACDAFVLFVNDAGAGWNGMMLFYCHITTRIAAKFADELTYSELLWACEGHIIGQNESKGLSRLVVPG